MKSQTDRSPIKIVLADQPAQSRLGNCRQPFAFRLAALTHLREQIRFSTRSYEQEEKNIVQEIHRMIDQDKGKGGGGAAVKKVNGGAGGGSSGHGGDTMDTPSASDPKVFLQMQGQQCTTGAAALCAIRARMVLHVEELCKGIFAWICDHQSLGWVKATQLLQVRPAMY